MDGIKLANVSKFYTVEKETIKVLDGIDLEIPQNKITIILGRSGCGKTTLLRLVSGLEGFDQGEILGSESKRKAYVFQEDRLMPWLDVKKNITFGIDKKDVQGYGNSVTTNREVINFVRNGKADVGVGLKKHIKDNENLEFIPIHKESYDLVIKTEDLNTYPCKAIMDVLKLEDFKRDCKENDNYDYKDIGKIIVVT